MKNYLGLRMVFVCLCTIGVWQGLSAQWTLRERFEGTGCNEFAWPFFEGCIPNWANASGTSDITGVHVGVKGPLVIREAEVA
ncbi:MAG: hypothetical protein AAF146_18355, partial [Bacteroidota bacterium]